MNVRLVVAMVVTSAAVAAGQLALLYLDSQRCVKYVPSAFPTNLCKQTAGEFDLAWIPQALQTAVVAYLVLALLIWVTRRIAAK